MDKPKKYKFVISKDTLLDIKSTKKYILDTFKYHPGFKRPYVLAIHYKENAEDQQINLLQSSRFGEGLRLVQDELDSKNYYICNPEFDQNCGCNNKKA